MSIIPKYVRLGIACIAALGISYIIFTRQYLTPTQFDFAALKNDLQTTAMSIASIQFKLPHFELISQRVEPTTTPDGPAPTMVFDTLPTRPPSPPIIHPTGGVLPTLPNFPTAKPSSSIPSLQPTQPPEPTKKPKPTKAPDIFPIDPSLKRPGETVDEIIAAAAAKACAPKEVLRTLASIESGGFFDTVSPKYLLLYNSENWWNSEYITEAVRVCSGYAYDGTTGNIFSDSKFADYHCPGRGSGGLSVVGVMQLSPYLFSHYKDKAAKAIGSKNVDRRIIFDSLVISGMNVKENTGATSCTNWDARTVVRAACSYYGSCGIADGTYYCATFCRNYQKYGGKDCSSAIKNNACGLL
jgi:hypothetical protein